MWESPHAFDSGTALSPCRLTWNTSVDPGIGPKTWQPDVKLCEAVHWHSVPLSYMLMSTFCYRRLVKSTLWDAFIFKVVFIQPHNTYLSDITCGNWSDCVNLPLEPHNTFSALHWLCSTKNYQWQAHGAASENIRRSLKSAASVFKKNLNQSVSIQTVTMTIPPMELCC